MCGKTMFDPGQFDFQEPVGPLCCVSGDVPFFCNQKFGNFWELMWEAFVSGRCVANLMFGFFQIPKGDTRFRISCVDLGNQA